MSTLLEVKDVCKRYGKKTALDHLNLTLESGHIVGLLGPNGSGKTTLIKLINGIITPDEGEILVEGMKIGVETKKVQLILVMSRRADLYVLDEPIAGVDPAARDYILRTILTNYDENATILISTHLIADVENVLDEVVFIQNGTISLTSSVDDIRINQGKSVDALFREVFRC